MEKLVSAQNQEKLLSDHLGLVKRIAYNISSRLPNAVQFEDLCQVGLMGVLEAEKRYDPNYGASFETYASIRIRGMMLDELRKLDWVPRSVYKSLKEVGETIKTLTYEYHREPTEMEVAKRLKMTLSDYQRLMSDYYSSHTQPFEEFGLEDDLMPSSATYSDPVEGAHQSAFYAALIKALENLPEKEKLVLSLYYDDELNLKAIGEVLSVTESRVCQIHSQAMQHLRQHLSVWRPTSH